MEQLQATNKGTCGTPGLTVALEPGMQRIQDELRQVAEKKMLFIAEHKEELLAAFIAKTGLQPDECELCIRTRFCDFSEITTVYWARRKEGSNAEIRGGVAVPLD